MTWNSLMHSGARPLGLSGASDGPTDRSRLQLRPSGDGWSLVGVDGRVVFAAVGRSARQRCLQFAQAGGVLALIS